MKILFSTGSLYYLPLDDIFQIAKETGFDGCDVVVNRHLDYRQCREILHECSQVLPIYALHVPFLKLPSWGNQVEAIIRSVEVAKDLRIPVVNLHPPSWFHLEINFLKWFRHVKDFQKELGCEDVALALENMPLMGKSIKLAPYLLNDHTEALRFGLARNLHFTFDTTHMATFDHDIVHAFLEFFRTRRLLHVHLSDYASPESHLFVGGGKLPIVRLLNTMRAVGYEGSISLEVSPTELPFTREWVIRILRYAASFLKMNVGREING
jgi:sugar phosphate isomerase/epimerase